VSSAINVFTDETLHTVRIIYLVNVVSGDLRVEVDGTTDAVEWMPLDRVGELRLAEFVIRALGRLRARKG
jgi:ADP-ribose pyrophosphatase YjhB (NUDIX family)